tara:strand:+ start:81 stop:1040 length:960 start_codon:yes stop_codon:yes gene_type:complete
MVFNTTKQISKFIRMSFANLKKKSRSGSLTEKLIRQVEKINDKGNSNVDERIWKPVVDKSGNGYAIIRFLPEPEGCDLPWSRVYTHAFQGTGGWYIENSLTTLGQKDPVSEHNSELWNSGSDANKEIARKQKRRLSYYSNIYVVSDPTNPENEGKVFLYKYGKKIFDKIMEAMKPEFADETPINPFDFWAGANFKLKIRRVEGYQNYDKSEFGSAEALFDDDAKLETIYNSLYNLNEFTDANNFKSYEKLKERLDSVLGLKKPVRAPIPDAELETEDEGRGYYAEQATASEPVKEVVAAETSSDEDDESLSYFSKLVNS